MLPMAGERPCGTSLPINQKSPQTEPAVRMVRTGLRRPSATRISAPPGASPDDSHSPVRSAAKHRGHGLPCLSAHRPFPRFLRTPFLHRGTPRRAPLIHQHLQLGIPHLYYHVHPPCVNHLRGKMYSVAGSPGPPSAHHQPQHPAEQTRRLHAHHTYLHRSSSFPESITG